MMIRPLSEDLQRKAVIELNEVPERIPEDLEHIKEWIRKQTHLSARTDDQWLLAFLRGCKYSLQGTRLKLDYFYTLRTLLPEFFENRDPFMPDIQRVLKAGVVFPLPKMKDPSAPRIIVLRWVNCNPDEITVTSMVKVYFMIVDMLMNEDDNTVVSGICLWSDLQDLSLNYLYQFTPSLLKKMIPCMQSAYPVRIKAVHYTNAPRAFEALFNLLKALTNKKLSSRLHMHNRDNFEKVYQDVPLSVMPKEYSGEGGSADDIAAEWKKKVESHKDWFLEDAKYFSNEVLRQGVAKTTAEEFGMEGAFRKLEID